MTDFANDNVLCYHVVDDRFNRPICCIADEFCSSIIQVTSINYVILKPSPNPASTSAYS
jgi:hypothetical protein